MVSHPFIIPDLAPEEPTAADRADASGKIAVLEPLLSKLRKANRCALLLSQEAAVREFPTASLMSVNYITHLLLHPAEHAIQPFRV